MSGPARPAALAQLREVLEMIKFQHSAFALPFALVGLLAAERGWPDLRTTVLVVLCMVTARTAAMTWNRIADRKHDAANPRTRERALPAGRIRLATAWWLLGASSAGFVAAAAALSPLTLVLAPVALLVILGYSLTKRFTWGTHFFLGLALALAPIGGWIAAGGPLSPAPLALGAGVLLWTAGFDLLHASQDAEIDRRLGLHSVPARFGVPAALRLARACHALAVVALVAFGVLNDHGACYHASVAVGAAALAWSHGLVRGGDLSRVGVAFFHANAFVAAVLLAGTTLDVALAPG